MKAIIYCFSGTGNTLFAARETVKALTGLGYETDIYRIVSEDSPLYAFAWVRSVSFGNFDVCAAAGKEGAYLTDSTFGYVPDPNNYDIAGFAYPVHAYNAPRFFLNFLKALPDLKFINRDMPAFLFKTCGKDSVFNGASSRLAARILQKKGFQPCIDIHMPMPNILSRCPDVMAKQMVEQTRLMSFQLAQMVREEFFPPCHFTVPATLFSFLLRVHSPAAKINGHLYKVDSERCTSCEKCVNACSCGNIYMVGRDSEREPRKLVRLPQIGGDCSMCLQCVITCPEGAISPGILKHRKLNPDWNYSKLLSEDIMAPIQFDPENPEASISALQSNLEELEETLSDIEGDKKEEPIEPVLSRNPFRKKGKLSYDSLDVRIAKMHLKNKK